MNKVCKKCGVEKSRDEFYKEKRVKDGLQARCIECCKTDAKAAFQNNPEAYRKRAREAYDYAERRERMLLKEYGITPDDYAKLFEQQKGCCAICGSQESGHNVTQHLLVDHDHITGKVRGLLCCNCNWLLGKAKADEGNKLLLGALFYLKAA